MSAFIHKIRERRMEVLGLLALLWAVIFKLYRIDSIPNGFNQDELGAVYDAWSLLHYGVDRWQVQWPVYFLNFGSGQNALYTYMLVPLFAVFGVSQTVIRVPALFSSFLLLFSGCGIIYLVWPEDGGIGSRKTAMLLYILIYGCTPYTQLSGRLGLESLLMLGFSTSSIFLLILATNRRNGLIYFLDGLFWGITLYTYAIAYVAVPAFLIVSGRLLYKYRRINLKECIAFLIPVISLALPLVLEQYINMFNLESVMIGPFTVTRLKAYRSGELTLSNIPTNLFLTLKSMLFFDWLDYNTIERYWTFFPMSVPFFFLGIMKHFSVLMAENDKGWKPSTLIFVWFVIILCMGCMLGRYGEGGTNPNTNKINAIFFTVMFYIVFGLCYAFRNCKTVKWKKRVCIVLIGLYSLFSIHFVHYYFHYFRPTAYWGYLFPDVINLIKSSDELSQKPVFSEEMYLSYLVSALPSPYEIDFENEMLSMKSNNWTHSMTYLDMEEAIKQYGKNAVYLVRYPPDSAIPFFQEEHFQTYKDGALTLYYCGAEDK